MCLSGLSRHNKALKLKAAETSRTVSDLINDAVREAMAEDAQDLEAFEERTAEPLISYGEMVKRLKKDGRDIKSFKKIRRKRF